MIMIMLCYYVNYLGSQIFNKIFDHNNYKYGDAISKIITDVKPRISTKNKVILLKYYMSIT